MTEGTDALTNTITVYILSSMLYMLIYCLRHAEGAIHVKSPEASRLTISDLLHVFCNMGEKETFYETQHTLFLSILKLQTPCCPSDVNHLT